MPKSVFQKFIDVDNLFLALMVKNNNAKINVDLLFKSEHVPLLFSPYPKLAGIFYIFCSSSVDTNDYLYRLCPHVQ